MKKILCATALVLSFTTDAFAYKNKLNVCKPTHQYHNNYEPEKFFTSNNLLRKTGGEARVCGEKILLKLEVVDKNCVPISDAKVYLWQVGCDGKYPYKPLRTRVEKHLINTKQGSSFVGSGIATTNNLGSAHFITIKPPNNHRQGIISIRVEHSQYGEFQTRLNMKDEHRIEDDNGSTPIYYYKVVAPWTNIHRKY